MDGHDEFVVLEDIFPMEPFVEHKIELSSSSLELVDPISFTFTLSWPLPHYL